MNMWKATRVSADMAKNVQVQAGILCKGFDVSNPVAPADANIICATSGDFNITCVPQTQDFYEDVNNVPAHTKEGLEIIDYDMSLTVNCIEINARTVRLALGAVADEGNILTSTGMKPAKEYSDAEFQVLYWLGDMKDPDKLFVVRLVNTVSTGGFSFTATKNGKGQLSLTLSPHFSLSNIDSVPMTFFILTKVEGEQTPPASTEEPSDPAEQTSDPVEG